MENDNELTYESSDESWSDDEINDCKRDSEVLQSADATFEQEMQIKANELLVNHQADQEFLIPATCDLQRNQDSIKKKESESGGSTMIDSCTDHTLFYDPDKDDKDEAWVQKRWKPYNKGKASKPQASDAILDCPACFSTLCLDCQRHETYKNQYRAMFTMNCVVDTSQTLKFPDKKQHVTTKQKSKPTSEVQTSQDFHPVTCLTCGTQVAVYDKDEVYHFFNVLASH